jgi:hypothetical protein
MKKKIFLLLLLSCTFLLSAQSSNKSSNKEYTRKMKLIIGNTTLTATLADNSSARALEDVLSKGSITIDMHDFSNFEKVGELGISLPQNNEQITTKPCDLILYLGNRFVIYYDTNSWNFTRLGKIDNISQAELKKILGTGNVTVTLSL